MFLRSQSWDIVKMVCPWATHFILKCFTWLRWKWVPGRTEMAMCTISSMRWNGCRTVCSPGSWNGTWMNRSSDQGVEYKVNNRSLDLISDYKKPAPLPLLKNPRWPPLTSKNQVSAILSLIMNIQTQNQCHFWSLIHESGQNIIFRWKHIDNTKFITRLYKIPKNSCIHSISNWIIIPAGVSPSNEMRC